jgi:hypothetical protein
MWVGSSRSTELEENRTTSVAAAMLSMANCVLAGLMCSITSIRLIRS